MKSQTCSNGLVINDDPCTIEEFRKVKSSLKIWKAAGPDDITPEVFKTCDFDEICLDFCNKAFIKNAPMRIQVRIGPLHPHACRKRRLNAAILRMGPEKPRSHVTAGVAR
jgi:hypothetical protein